MLRLAAVTIPKNCLFFLFSFFITHTCFGQGFVISKSTKLPYDLSSEVSLFEDATAKLSFQEVQKQAFIKHEKKSVLLPFSNQATWLKIDLKNESYQDTTFYLVIENPLIRRTTFYSFNHSDSVVYEAFNDKGFSKLKTPFFQINLKPSESKSYYLKFESQRGIYFRFKLYDSKHTKELNDSDKLILGIVIGLTWMVIFIVCIIGFLVIRDNKSKAYAIYTLLRAFSFWATLNVFGGFFGVDAPIYEKVTFALMNTSPIITAFLSLNILPFESLPRWTKQTTYGLIIVNLLLLILSFVAYGPVVLKSLVILNLVSHLFFYPLIIFTLIKKINQSPFYAIPFLLGNFGNFLMNSRVLGITNLEELYPIAIFVALTEIAVYVYYLSQNFRASVKIQAEKLRNLGFEAEKAAKLEELDKLKTRFFTNISHEFRTPLTLLVGPIEDLKKKFPQEGIIDVMQRNLQRLQTLINQLLDLSKLEAGEMKPNLQEIDLNNFLNQLVASFESLAHSKHIIFKHTQPHTPHFALFDTDKLEKIVTNLLSNAFKFTPENGRIVIKIEYSGNQLIVQIQDSGIGIEETRLPHIFDRFYQVEEHNNHEGTGIGLALVKELVDLLKGTIEVSSKKGVGTTFELVLPFTPLEKLSNPVVQFERKVNVGESLISANPKIDSPIEADGRSIMLIVEDNPDLQNYIASVFDNQYQIILAIDGEDGLTKAIEFIPDIVISDLMMPKLDGLSFCEKLKTDERTSHIPVVILTAKASLSDRLAGLEHGADDYLSKPFNKEELQIRVKNLVNQRQKLLEKFAVKTIIEKKEEIKEPTIDEIFVQKCQSVIDKYLDRSEFDVEKFADEMKLSPVQLRRKLKAITDQNVTEFVRNYRLEIAAKLLKTSDFSVSEIAYKVGFDSMPYFSKVFQDKYGKTASEWKE